MSLHNSVWMKHIYTEEINSIPLKIYIFEDRETTIKKSLAERINALKVLHYFITVF